jgi:hypothetical protein
MYIGEAHLSSQTVPPPFDPPVTLTAENAVLLEPGAVLKSCTYDVEFVLTSVEIKTRFNASGEDCLSGITLRLAYPASGAIFYIEAEAGRLLELSILSCPGRKREDFERIERWSLTDALKMFASRLFTFSWIERKFDRLLSYFRSR